MSADKMLPLPAYDLIWRAIRKWDRAQSRSDIAAAASAPDAAVHAYAAEQTRELVEALEALLEGAESMLGTCGCVRGDTPEDADTFTHDEWAEDFLTERATEARALIARHKEQA